MPILNYKGLLLFLCVSFLLPQTLFAQEQEPANASISLTLLRAIRQSLENNPEITVLELDPQEASQSILEAQGALDLTYAASANLGKSVSPSSSSISGSSFVQNSAEIDFEVSKAFSQGTEFSLFWENSRIENDELYTTLNPEWRSRLGLSLTQPLLKGAGSGRPEMLIKLAKKQHEAALWDYRASIAAEVLGVIKTYWNKKLAEAKVAVNQKSMQLAEKLREEAEVSVSLGVVAPIAISQASAQVALRKEELLSSQNRLSQADNLLRKTIGQEQDITSNIELVIADELRFYPLEFDVGESLEKALADRAEVKAQQLRLASGSLSRTIASNRTLPELNLFGSTSVQGLAGAFQPSSFDTEQNSVFEGDYGDALADLGGGNYYSLVAGIEIKHSLENRAARSRLNRAEIELLREKKKQEVLKRLIRVEVKDAIEELQTAVSRISAANEAKRFAAKSLKTARERFKAGVSTTREILELQEDQAAAELAVAEALVDFQVSVAAVYLSRGELLEKHGIKLLE